MSSPSVPIVKKKVLKPSKRPSWIQTLTTVNEPFSYDSDKEDPFGLIRPSGAMFAIDLKPYDGKS